MIIKILFILFHFRDIYRKYLRLSGTSVIDRYNSLELVQFSCVYWINKDLVKEI